MNDCPTGGHRAAILRPLEHLLAAGYSFHRAATVALLRRRAVIFDPTIGERRLFWDELPNAQRDLELEIIGGCRHGRRG